MDLGTGDSRRSRADHTRAALVNLTSVPEFLAGRPSGDHFTHVKKNLIRVIHREPRRKMRVKTWLMDVELQAQEPAKDRFCRGMRIVELGGAAKVVLW